MTGTIDSYSSEDLRWLIGWLADHAEAGTLIPPRFQPLVDETMANLDRARFTVATPIRPKPEPTIDQIVDSLDSRRAEVLGILIAYFDQPNPRLSSITGSLSCRQIVTLRARGPVGANATYDTTYSLLNSLERSKLVARDQRKQYVDSVSAPVYLWRVTPAGHSAYAMWNAAKEAAQ